MPFRDDREALRTKAELLEGEVEDLRVELDRARAALAAHESKDEHDEAELARLKQEVARLGPKEDLASAEPDPATRNRSALLAGVVVFAVGLGMLFWIQQRSTRERPEPTPFEVPSSVGLLEPPARPADHVAPAVPGPLDVMRFGAVVASADPAELHAGDGCVIEAEISPSREVGRVWVWCDELLYDSAMDGGTEMTAHESSASPLEVETGREVYSMTYRDTGTRTGPRPQIVIDTVARTARIWRDEMTPSTPLVVRLDLDDRSAPVDAPLGSEAPRASSLVDVHVRAVPRHAASSRTGGACELRLHAEEQGQPSCRALLRCPSGVLYGARTLGYGRCGAAEELAGPLRFDDDAYSADDGDPELHLNVPEGRLTISDEVDGRSWREELQLEEDPRCSLEGSWDGRLRTRAGIVGRVALSPSVVSTSTVTVDGRRTRETRSESAPMFAAPGLESREASFELECERGRGVIVVEGERYEGRFGPDFATFLAERVGGGELLWLRRVPNAEPLPDVDLSAIPPEAREGVRRALREALH